MLKPRKCRKLLLIISPQLKAAKGKKLFAINGEWSGKEFIKFVNATPSVRPQLGMVARNLGNIYRRHMQKHFPQPSVTVDDITAFKADSWTRTKPTRSGGELEAPMTGGIMQAAMVDFNFHDHLPNTDQKHYFATPEPTPKNNPFGDALGNGLMMHRRLVAASGASCQDLSEVMETPVNEPTGHTALTTQCRAELEGEVLPPELEIKGVHLKQSKLSRERVEKLVEEFGTIAEKELIARFYADTGIINPDDEEAVQSAARRCLFNE